MIAERIQPVATNARSVRVPARAPRWVVPLVKTLLVFTDVGLVSLSFVGIDLTVLSIFGGAVAVQNRIDIEFRLHATRVPPNQTLTPIGK